MNSRRRETAQSQEPVARLSLRSNSCPHPARRFAGPSYPSNYLEPMPISSKFAIATEPAAEPRPWRPEHTNAGTFSVARSLYPSGVLIQSLEKRRGPSRLTPGRAFRGPPGQRCNFSGSCWSWQAGLRTAPTAHSVSLEILTLLRRSMSWERNRRAQPGRCRSHRHRHAPSPK